MKRLFLLSLLILLPGQLLAEEDWRDAAGFPEGGSGNRYCKQADVAAIPKADLPRPSAQPALGSDCNSARSYYGHGQAKDDAMARRCAFVERDAQAKTQETSMGAVGSGTLMMIYANGRGVPRNIALAKRFACEMWSADAELDLRIQHLDAMAKDPGLAPIDVCDDITSGAMMGQCAAEAEVGVALKRDEGIAKLSANWARADRDALAQLRKRSDSFFDAVASNEEDMSGTARGLIYVQRESALQDEFAQSLARLETGHYPGRSLKLREADARLNATYRQVLATLKAETESGEGFNGTVTADGVRQTQRLWIAYRDAWVAFARVHRPALPAAAMAVQITNERERMLRGYLSDE